MTLKNYLLYSVLLVFLNCFFGGMKAQNMIKGIVTDSISNEPQPFVSVTLKGTTSGVTTDYAGRFVIKVPPGQFVLTASSIAFHEKSISITNQKTSNVKIQLIPNSYSMSEVVVKRRNLSYRRKGNPAVDFVRRVIESKNRYNPFNKPYYQLNHREQITVAMNDFQKDKNKLLLTKYGFLTNYTDTSDLSGKAILPVSVREMMELNEYRKSPYLQKNTILYSKSSGIDEFLSEDGVDQYLKEAFKDVDIYDNDIYLFLKPFVSPLSTAGPAFYKYYLLDTVQIAGEKCVDLGFVPFSPEASGFVGHLFVTLDSSNFVKKAILNLPKDINLNFIQNLCIEQEFNRAADSTRLLIKDNMAIEFSIFPKGDGFYAKRSNIYSNFSFDCPPDSLVSNRANASTKTAESALNHRPDTLASGVNSVEKMLKQLRNDPFYYVTEKIVSAALTGYVPTASVGNKFTLGPIYSTASINAVEGLRLRVGGFSTALLNDRWFTNGYLAYGLNDRKVKGLAQLEYSFIKKKKQANEFPINSVRASYFYDINRLGQNYLYTTADNLLLSLKRLPDDKITFLRKMELSYNREFYSQFSAGIDFRYRTEYATVNIPFVDNTSGRSLDSYSTGELQLRLRYAPGEKFYQSMGRRRSIKLDVPVFSLSQILAIRNVLNSSYTYSRTEFGFQQRFWFSTLGNVRMIVKAGKVWTKAPFPLLIIPAANLTYTTQSESFAMMNALEFVSDQYLSWDLNYNLNGLILNRIPLLKTLKLREILTFRGFYGSLNDENNPALSNNLFSLPSGTSRMGNEPYMEVGVGILNIFKFLRLDYIWRLNYLNRPNIEKSGLRFNLELYF